MPDPVRTASGLEVELVIEEPEDSASYALGLYPLLYETTEVAS